MQEKQYAPQDFNQSAQSNEGTRLDHGADIGFRVGDIAKRQEIANALADIDEAIQPLEETVQRHLEYTPLSPQERIRLNGRSVLYFRKGHEENTFNLEKDELATSPYIFKPENGQPDQYVAKSWNTTEQSTVSSKEDFDLAA
ncbi:MAG TPA: hypothetical protein VGO98_03060 [Candidatus Saccharimonadales bacterium]|nr:hypothetical protein [Candidatus Saccharimonadales bacterium]